MNLEKDDVFTAASDCPGSVTSSLKRSEPAVKGVQSAIFHEVEGISVIGMSDDELNFFHSFTPAMRKRLLWKIDIRLLPWLALLYFVSHLDRGTIGNAKIEGMAADLRLSGSDYNVALAVFFISYILCDYLGGLTMLFGLVVIGHGLIHNLAGLTSLRLLLGVFEAGFPPAAIYLCSSWYMLDETSVRVGCFYFTGAMSGAFSGLLSAGISKMNGIGGYAGWRWIFIILGILTFVAGALASVFLIDVCDEKMTWLTPDEHRLLLIQYKIKQGGFTVDGKDADGGPRGLNTKNELSALAKDWKTWMFALAIFPMGAGFYSLKYTLPSLTKAMGFPGGTTTAQLISAPPYVLAGLLSIIVPYISDRQRKRSIWLALGFLMYLLGAIILLGLGGNMSGWRKGFAYFAVCVAATGVYPMMPIICAWTMRNTTPAGRRALASALLVMSGNLGGVLGSFQYLEKEAPKYSTGFKIAVACGVLGVLCSIVLMWAFQRENKKREALNPDEIRSKYTDEQLLAMGNNSPLFRYCL